MNHRRKRSAVLAIALLTATTTWTACPGRPEPPPPGSDGGVTQVDAGNPHPEAQLVLHALPADYTGECNHPQLPALQQAADAITSVEPEAEVDIYLLLKTSQPVRALQTRFAWPEGWTVRTWRGRCQGNEVYGATPGPVQPELALAFDTQAASGLIPIGALTVVVGPSGCLELPESAFPFGTHFVDNLGDVHAVAPEARARVCVAGGAD